MEPIWKKATVTDESAAVPDGGLIAALSSSYATHFLQNVCVCVCWFFVSECVHKTKTRKVKKNAKKKQQQEDSVV